MIDDVDHPVGTYHNFANGHIANLRNHAAQFRVIREPFDAGNQQLAERGGALRRVRGDVTDDIAKIAPRRDRQAT
jgi:hypothetical protein